ncbi:MAG: hypothetical protein FWE19_07790 [Oscillospiraceae bacterium]|nr:hypothetical protein [Oscillospiraceae bacterium]
MEALFDGRVIPWERRVELTGKRKSALQKIESEKRYFIEKMSLDDCRRFEEFEGLLVSEHHCEDVDTYAHGFTLGALIMMEVLDKKGAHSGQIEA